MARPKATISAIALKPILLVLSFLCLTTAAIVGVIGSYRVDASRRNEAQANAPRGTAERQRVTQETQLKAREIAVAGEEARIAQAENRAAKVEAELLQLQKEKTEWQAKLEEKQNEIGSLQKRIEQAQAPVKPPEKPSAAATPKEEPTAARPSPEIKPEHVEETTPPRQRPRKQETVTIKGPTVPVTTGTTSSAKGPATYAPPPEYPREPRLNGTKGSGVCVVAVDPRSGEVIAASMEQSTGNGTLDKAAVSALQKWRFKPGTVSKVRIPVEFTLTGTTH
jgi:periplasmic protein TonB